jgi:predicted GIY-YIG superfamily endonuclease
MNSKDLPEFKSISDFELSYNQAPQKPGVYLLRTKGGTIFHRILGETDILYIGSTENLKKRFYGYNHPGSSQYTNQKVKNFVVNLGHEAEFLWKEETDSDRAKITEHELISRYQREHHEFPPLNGASIRKMKLRLPTEKLEFKDNIDVDIHRA